MAIEALQTKTGVIKLLATASIETRWRYNNAIKVVNKAEKSLYDIIAPKVASAVDIHTTEQLSQEIEVNVKLIVGY